MSTQLPYALSAEKMSLCYEVVTVYGGASDKVIPKDISAQLFDKIASFTDISSPDLKSFKRALGEIRQKWFHNCGDEKYGTVRGDFTALIEGRYKDIKDIDPDTVTKEGGTAMSASSKRHRD